MNWIKEESEKLLKFIETAPEAELDAALAAVQFGSLVNEVAPVENFASVWTVKTTVSAATITQFLAIQSEGVFQDMELFSYPLEEMPLAV